MPTSVLYNVKSVSFGVEPSVRANPVTFFCPSGISEIKVTPVIDPVESKTQLTSRKVRPPKRKGERTATVEFSVELNDGSIDDLAPFLLSIMGNEIDGEALNASNMNETGFEYTGNRPNPIVKVTRSSGFTELLPLEEIDNVSDPKTATFAIKPVLVGGETITDVQNAFDLNGKIYSCDPLTNPSTFQVKCKYQGSVDSNIVIGASILDVTLEIKSNELIVLKFKMEGDFIDWNGGNQTINGIAYTDTTLDIGICESEFIGHNGVSYLQVKETNQSNLELSSFSFNLNSSDLMQKGQHRRYSTSNNGPGNSTIRPIRGVRFNDGVSLSLSSFDDSRDSEHLSEQENVLFMELCSNTGHRIGMYFPLTQIEERPQNENINDLVGQSIKLFIGERELSGFPTEFSKSQMYLAMFGV